MIPKLKNLIQKLSQTNINTPTDSIKEESFDSNFKTSNLHKELIAAKLAKLLPTDTFIEVDNDENVFVSTSKGQEIYYSTNSVEAAVEYKSGQIIYRIIESDQEYSNDNHLITKKFALGIIRPQVITEIKEETVEVEKEFIVEKSIPVRNEISIIKETDKGKYKILDKYKRVEEISMPIIYPLNFIEEYLIDSVSLLLKKNNLDSTVSSAIKNNKRDFSAIINRLNEIEVINPELIETTMYGIFCESYSIYSFQVCKADKRKLYFKVNPKEKLTKSMVLDHLDKNNLRGANIIIFISIQNKDGINHLKIHDLVSLTFGETFDYLII